MLEKGLDLLQGTKREAIMIGDSNKDIEAANNAGIDSLLVYPQGHTIFYDLDQLKSYNPIYIVSNFKEISLVLD